MFVIAGILMVLGAVLAGFMMEKGPVLVLMQPSEFVIIAGAALGSTIAANPVRVLKKIASGITSTLAGSKMSKKIYLDTLKMMFNLFNKSRRDGLVAIESDIEDPEKSPLFTKYPSFLKDHHVRAFVCDTLRMAVTGGATPFDLDQMMELDMEVHHAGATQPVTAWVRHLPARSKRTERNDSGALALTAGAVRQAWLPPPPDPRAGSAGGRRVLHYRQRAGIGHIRQRRPVAGRSRNRPPAA